MNASVQKDITLIDRMTEGTGLSASALAVKAGVAASTLTRVVGGQSRLSRETLEKLKAVYPSYFGDISDMPDDPRDRYVEVEVMPSYAGMGGGGFGEGEPERALVPRQLVAERLRANPEDLLMLDVRGDSNAPEFQHGDQILIDRRDTDPTQPGFFALWDGDAYVVKLVERVPREKGMLRIFSANQRYQDYTAPIDEVRILGRPVYFGRAL